MTRKILYPFASIPILFFLAAYTESWHQLMNDTSRHGVSSSLVDYLYPKGEIPPEFDGNVPNLNLPLLFCS